MLYRKGKICLKISEIIVTMTVNKKCLLVCLLTCYMSAFPSECFLAASTSDKQLFLCEEKGKEMLHLSCLPFFILFFFILRFFLEPKRH